MTRTAVDTSSGPNEGDWLTTAQAAARLGSTPRRLYELIDSGELMAYRFGRVIRLRRSDVDALGPVED